MKRETREKIQDARDKIVSLTRGVWHPYVPLSEYTDPLEKILEALAAEPDEPTVSNELSQAEKYAKHLCLAMVKAWPYNPDWKPEPDLLGLLTQIDNMVAGMMIRPEQPTVSKSVEELADDIFSKLHSKYQYMSDDLAKDLQSFLDAQIAERDNEKTDAWLNDILVDEFRQEYRKMTPSQKHCVEMAFNWTSPTEAQRIEKREEMYKCVKELREVILEVLPTGDIYEGLAPYYIHSDTIKRMRQLLENTKAEAPHE